MIQDELEDTNITSLFGVHYIIYNCKSIYHPHFAMRIHNITCILFMPNSSLNYTPYTGVNDLSLTKSSASYWYFVFPNTKIPTVALLL